MAETILPITTGYPCSYCGVNAWTPCRHRAPERSGEPPEGEPDPPSRRGNPYIHLNFGIRINRVARAKRR